MVKTRSLGVRPLQSQRVLGALTVIVMEKPQNKPKGQKPKKKRNGKNARKKKSRRRRPASRDSSRDAGTAFHLSDCAEKYVDSLLDPFTGPADACIPLLPSFPSQKIRVFTRGNFASQTSNSLAWLSFVPRSTSDAIAGYYSSATSTASGFANSGTGVSSYSHSNSPFLDADLSGSSIQCRLVSAGMRVRYAGTVLNAGGTVYALEEPAHKTILGKTNTDMMTYDRCLRLPIKADGQWVTLCWAPMDADECEYGTTSAPTGITVPMMGIMAVVAASTSVSFDFECFSNWEIIGTKARGATMNKTDVTGTGLVQQAVRMVGNGQVDNKLLTEGRKLKTHKGLLATIGRLASGSISGFLPKALKTALPLVGALL